MRRSRRWLAVSLVLAFCAGGCVSCGAEDAVRNLPPRERQALYERTLANVAAVCQGAPAVRYTDFCVAQAELLAGMPQCDETCHRLVWPITSPAVR